MTNSLPVLMYHSLEENLQSNMPDLIHSTTITLAAFAAQMEWLHLQGYTSIGIEELFDNKSKKNFFKKVLITFDDGFISTLSKAAPILKKYNLTATLFLPVGPIGKKSFEGFDGLSGILNERPLNWDEIKQLQNGGWSIQAHGISHRKLSKLNDGEILVEFEEGKRIIEKNLDVKVNYFAYPFGDYDTRVLQCLHQAGYHAGFSVHTGKASLNADHRRLNRIEINSLDTLKTFINKINTGYPSSGEKVRSKVRSLLYYNSSLKDFIQKVLKP